VNVEPPRLPPAHAVLGAGPGRAIRALGLVGMVVLGGAATVAVTRRVDVVTVMPGEIVVEPGVVTLRAPVSGSIARLPVRDGDVVPAGTTLFVMASDEIEARLGEAKAEIARQRARVRAAGGLLAGAPPDGVDAAPSGRLLEDQAWVQWARAEHERLEAELARVRGACRRLETELDVLKARRVLVREIHAGARERLERARALAGRGVAPKTAVESARIEEAEARGRVEDVEGRVAVVRAELEAEVAQGEQSRRRAIARWTGLYLDALSALAAAEGRQRGLAARLGERVVAAPVAGELELGAGIVEGAVATVGEPIVRVVPVDGRLLVRARLDERDLRRVRPGAPATVRLAALPSTRSARFPARVVRVAAAAGSDADRRGTRAFRVTIALTTDAPEFVAHHARLAPGMQASVEVRQGRRRIVDYFLEPVLELGSRVGREP